MKTIFGSLGRRILASVLMLAATLPGAFAQDGGAAHRRQLQRSPLDQTPWTVAAPVRFDTSVQSMQLRAFPLEQPLIARAGGVEFASAAFNEASAAGMGASAPLPGASTSRAEAGGRGLPLPQPSPAAALFATLALGLFFFLRRIV